MIEIDCPETCEFLKAGREWEMADYASRVRAMDLSGLERRRRLFAERQNELAQMEYAIARNRLSDRNLKDHDVIAAITVLLESYQTEDKGVLYEKTSEDLRVEALRRELKKVIESLRNPEKPEQRGIVDPATARLPLAAAIDCLEFIRDLARMYASDRHTDSGYVNFLARLFPREEKRSSILLP